MRVCRRQFRQAQRTYERNDTTEGPDGDDQPSAVDIVGDDAGKAEYSGADDQSDDHRDRVEQRQSLSRLTDAHARRPAMSGSIRRNCFMASPYRSEEHTSELQSLMRISYA